MAEQGFSKWGVSRRRMAGLLMVVAILPVLGCSAVYDNHGYIPTDEELALVVVGKDTRDTVATTIGRPSTEGLLNDQGWYYVQSKWRNYGALPPKEVDRQVVAITFSTDGIVENIERFGIEKGQIVPISRRITESNIKGVGFLQQLFGSLGRISADQLLGK